MANDNFVGLTGQTLPQHNVEWSQSSVGIDTDLYLTDASGDLTGSPSDRLVGIVWRNRGGFWGSSSEDVSNILIQPRADGLPVGKVCPTIRMSEIGIGYTVNISAQEGNIATNLLFEKEGSWIGGQGGLSIPTDADIELEMIGTIQGADLLIEVFVNRGETPVFTYLDTDPLPPGSPGVYLSQNGEEGYIAFWSDELLSGDSKVITQIGDVEIGVGVTSNQGTV